MSAKTHVVLSITGFFYTLCVIVLAAIYPKSVMVVPAAVVAAIWFFALGGLKNPEEKSEKSSYPKGDDIWPHHG